MIQGNHENNWNLNKHAGEAGVLCHRISHSEELWGELEKL